MFALDSRLLADGPILEDLVEGHVVIQKTGTQYPWLVVVPRVSHASEIFDLNDSQCTRLFTAVSRLAAALKMVTGACKINVECIGNVCAQLHVHIIARKEDDPAWPAPVWGIPFEAVPPDPDFAAKMQKAMNAF